MTVIRYPNQSRPRRPHLAELPRARIETMRHRDGRWMWAVSFNTNECGGGYCPRAKWGHFAATEAAAIEAGIEELRNRLAKRANPNNSQARKIEGWLDEVAAPHLQPTST